MSHRDPRRGLVRREFLGATAAVPGLAGLPIAHVSAQESKAAAGKTGASEKWAIPGPFPGRVIEVRNPRMIQNGVKSHASIKESVNRGMKELTGAG